MGVKDSLRESFKELEDFVKNAMSEANDDMVDFEGRDAKFLEEARTAIDSPNISDLESLLGEMRGLSQFFCSYAKDTDTLDRLVEHFFHEVQNIVLAARSKSI